MQALKALEKPGSKLELRQYVIGLCPDLQAAALGEIMIIRLGQGYVGKRRRFV